ncbi:molybdopterin guanine dinucleotide biosynthesis protein MoaE [Sodalis glossinidius str. 'morsitans']|uniref:Molybdopterin guanine dinucleotide biosynthesis protein MoaE n=1 Tax=Sodalis glossinidius (strain morsitans) TaxID=343509 RepID=A0A193QHV2_SODGM|nr:molybdopterin guanine dinucleotide biosynthesis protein MoaE [Sodalis glossinidius str. 'morsitans']
MEATLIEVGEGDFDVVALYAWLSASDNDGAVVTFTGKALADIAVQERERLPLT